MNPGENRLIVSVGCPSGIGPEVSAVAAVECSSRVLLVGDHGAIVVAARARGIDEARFVRVAEAAFLDDGRVGVLEPLASLAEHDRAPGKPSRAGGAAQLAWIDVACSLVARGVGDALVTGPVSKEAIAQSGAPGSAAFVGHTEHLAARLAAPEVVMAFANPGFTAALVTTHLALARVPAAITSEAVARSAFWLAELLGRMRAHPWYKGPDAPRVAVAGLNPHAGEHGLFGDEERTAIDPGIRAARERLEREGLRATLTGPVPAESAFRLAAAGSYDGVLAMYHDQATIPMKLVGFGEAVNISLGLPIVRTSVDHGTAYDRAASFNADARGMKQAMALGAWVARPRR